jgi:hypothetical protein
MAIRLTTEADILAMAADMARKGETHGDIADALAAHTGLLRSFVVDLLRRKQSLWMAV